MHFKSFKNYPLETEIIESLDTLGYHQPTEVQELLLDVYSQKQDLVILSQTGSGKTAAFGIPLINEIEWSQRDIQALILVPTRELAQQVQKELFQIGRYKRLNVVSVFGKDSMKRQIADLGSRAHIVVGTPGRVMDHIQRGSINLSKVETLILDEADEMMNLGFHDSVTEIAGALPKHRTIMLSATMNPKIESVISRSLRDPQILEANSSNTVENRIRQIAVVVDENYKVEGLIESMIAHQVESSIIFCNRKHIVDEICDSLKDFGLSVQKLHGGMDQKSRSDVMKQFKEGKFRYLVATDVAARGLDIDNIQTIINFDLPDHSETFTHRIGRTARMDLEGVALSLVTQKELSRFRKDFASDAEVVNRKMLDVNELLTIRFRDMQKNKRTIIKEKVKYTDIVKLHIKSGKKQKLRAGDVVGAITSIEGIGAEDIGVIQVLEESTYVEILNKKGKQVLKALASIQIKGKVRRVERALKNDN